MERQLKRVGVVDHVPQASHLVVRGVQLYRVSRHAMMLLLRHLHVAERARATYMAPLTLHQNRLRQCLGAKHELVHVLLFQPERGHKVLS